MATNTYQVTQADNLRAIPLRGDMAANIGFVPSAECALPFVTKDAGTYVITSVRPINGVSDASANSLTVTGLKGQSFMLHWDAGNQEWSMGLNNLVAKTASNATSSTGTTGGTTTPATSTNSAEVFVPVDSSGNITLDGSTGNRNFRTTLTRSAKLLNPVGFNFGDSIKMFVTQGPGAPYNLSLDTLWAPPGSQSLKLANSEGGLSKLSADFTGPGPDGKWPIDVSPSGWAQGYAAITTLAKIGTTEYYYMGTPTYHADWVAAMPNVQPGQTIAVLRNGLGEEATGTIQGVDGATYIINGVAIATTGEKRPKLELLQTDFSTGGSNRPSFGKAIINLEGPGTTIVRDLILTGARNDDGDARGICPNASGHNLDVQNVLITNCNNGILSGNAGHTGYIHITNSILDGNSVGSPDLNNSHGTGRSDGFVHNIYAGHNNAEVTISHSNIINALTGHDIKCRTGTLTVTASLIEGATNGREIDFPNGGVLHVTDSIIHKKSNATTGSMVAIGNTDATAPGAQEGIDSSRPREYIFTRCRFLCEYGGDGRDIVWMSSRDFDVPVQFIDCEFIGTASSTNSTPGNDPFTAGMVTVNGFRYMQGGAAPIFTTTPGVTPGPAVAVGCPANVAMTPIV